MCVAGEFHIVHNFPLHLARVDTVGKNGVTVFLLDTNNPMLRVSTSCVPC